MIIDFIIADQFYLMIIDFINFLIPLFCIYTSVLVILKIKNKIESLYQCGLILLCLFYELLLIRYTLFDSLDLSVDILLWSFYEFLVFIMFITRNYLCLKSH